MAFILLLSISACAAAKQDASQMMPREQATVAGYSMATAYQDLYAAFVDAEKALGAADKQMPGAVRTGMNALKRAILTYNDAVLVWIQSGTEPDGLDRQHREINQLIADLSINLAALGVL
jgi:hypothetical protein